MGNLCVIILDFLLSLEPGVGADVGQMEGRTDGQTDGAKSLTGLLEGVGDKITGR